MKCPACAYEESKVVDSRPSPDGNMIRRRRECLACGKRFTTYETIETAPLVVVKRDKSREAYDRSKVLSSIIRCCDKRHRSENHEHQARHHHWPSRICSRTGMQRRNPQLAYFCEAEPQVSRL